MAPTIQKCAPAEIIGTELIADHHPLLGNARIIYLMTSAKRTDRGSRVLATVHKASGILKFLTNQEDAGKRADYYLLITEEYWLQMKPEQRRIIIDEQLHFCRKGEDDKNGQPTWELAGYDVEVHHQMVKLYGNYKGSLQVMATIQKQLPLPLSSGSVGYIEEHAEVGEDDEMDEAA